MKLLYCSLFVALVGCGEDKLDAARSNISNSISADFSFVDAGHIGYVNSAGFEAGEVFRWDTGTNSIDKVGRIANYAQSSPIYVGDKQITSIKGVKVNAGGALLEKLPVATIEAQIGTQTKVTIRNAERYQYAHLAKQPLFDFIASAKDKGINVNSPDFLDLKNPDTRIILVTSATRADSLDISLGGVDPANPSAIASVNLSAAGVTEFGASVVASSRNSCGNDKTSAKEKKSLCAMALLVMNPVVPETKVSPDFPTDSTYDTRKLIDALRNMK